MEWFGYFPVRSDRRLELTFVMFLHSWAVSVVWRVALSCPGGGGTAVIAMTGSPVV